MKLHTDVAHGALQYCLITLGWICIVLGVLGIFLPLLPTTVFILIAAWCFARSSERFYLWLNNHPKLGPIVYCWRTTSGITRNIRNRAITVLWISMLLSMLIMGKLWVVLLLLVIGCSVSVYLFKLPLLENLPCPMAMNNQSKATSTSE